MSNQVTTDDVVHIAKLANLTVSKSEQERFAEAFTKTLEEISHLQELDTSQIEPTHHTTGLVNVWREDVVNHQRLLAQSAAIAQAPHTFNGYVVVDRIIEEES